MLFASRNFSYTNKVGDLLTQAVTPYPTISIPENSSSEVGGVITPSASRNIEVLSPLTGDSLKDSFVVKGNARTNDNTVNIRLSDSIGNVLLETTAIANPPSAGQFGPFEKLITFKSDDDSGTLEFFQYNYADGSIIDVVEMPITFSQ